MKYLGFPLPELGRLSTPFVRRDAEFLEDIRYIFSGSLGKKMEGVLEKVEGRIEELVMEGKKLKEEREGRCAGELLACN